jgi:Ca2+-binding RTX toxin-like protein
VADNVFSIAETQALALVAPFDHATVVRNHVYGPDPEQATGAIVVSGQSGDALVADNLVDHVSGCNCGNTVGISIGASGLMEARVLNNTVDSQHVPSEYSTEGIRIGPGLLAIVSNNTVTHGSTGIVIHPAASATGSNNNTYDMVEQDELGNQPVEIFHRAPKFVDPSSRDYALKGKSPLVDAGEACIADTPLPRSDLSKHFRLAGRTVDVGALERGSKRSGSVAGVSKSGSTLADDLRGTRGVDVLCGLSAADTLKGLGGNDFIFGDGGNDILSGGGGGDLVTAGPGSDNGDGGKGPDRMYFRDGKRHNDSLSGGIGRDLCVADKGDIKSACP